MPMDRREFIRLSALGCACCLAVAKLEAAERAAHGGKDAAHWSYSGDTGPQRWGELQPDFKVCALGTEQTPIDLSGAMSGDTGTVGLEYKSLPIRVVNNGHTIQVNADPGSSCVIGGTKYDLLQFHFHHPSEHLLSGKAFDLECHFVHRSSAGAFAVLGVFIRSGARNPALAPLFDAMPKTAGPEIKTPGSIDPAALIPKSGGFFRYIGSLTTPPCSEGLAWTVFKQPIEASTDQIRQLAQLFPNNARPLQGLNRRFLIETN